MDTKYKSYGSMKKNTLDYVNYVHRVPKRIIQKHFECMQAILNHMIPYWWQTFPMVRTFGNIFVNYSMT